MTVITFMLSLITLMREERNGILEAAPDVPGPSMGAQPRLHTLAFTVIAIL